MYHLCSLFGDRSFEQDDGQNCFRQTGILKDSSVKAAGGGTLSVIHLLFVVMTGSKDKCQLWFQVVPGLKIRGQQKRYSCLLLSLPNF